MSDPPFPVSRRVSRSEVLWTQRQVGALDFGRARDLYALLAAPLAGRAVPVPVHVYAGTDDALFEVEIFREVATLLLGEGHVATDLLGYTEFEGAGHALQKTHCHEIAASLDAWMLRAISHHHHQH